MIDSIVQLAIVFSVAAGLGIAARLLKQPIILAYIFTGLLIGWFDFFSLSEHIASDTVFKTFSELGIMFLLFLIGMEINYSALRLVGKASLLVGLGQILFTFVVGFGIANLFNFETLHAAYIAVALTFSSTVIVVKLLSEKKDTDSLYGKISIGFLLVQDFIAILILIMLAGLETGAGVSLGTISITLIKGMVLFGLMLWLGRKLLPMLFHKIAHSHELLFLGALAWCFLTVAGVREAGFSTEIGGFLAGLALANSAEHFQIANRVRSLRDFFILVFFAILGSSLVFSDFTGFITPIIIFSLFVLIGNPLIVLVIMGLMGYRKRTSFLCGITVAQVSEFSLILAALGLSLGHLSQEHASLITAVAIITIVASTYMILYNEQLFKRLERFLTIFERRTKRNESFREAGYKKPIVIVGAHRIGRSIAVSLPKEDVLVIDFNPDAITAMRKEGYLSLFGDISDPEIIEKANIPSARLLISTSPSFGDNIRILETVKQMPKKPHVVVRAEDEADAGILYQEGADYVLLPHFTSGHSLGFALAKNHDLSVLENLKKKDQRILEEVKSIGFKSRKTKKPKP